MIVVKDLLAEKKLTVNFADPLAEITPGNILFLRLLKIGEKYEYSTGALVLPAGSKVSLLRRLWEDYKSFYLERGLSRGTIECYLKEMFPRINSLVMELANKPGLERNALPGRNEHLENWLMFQVRDLQAVLNIIKKSDSFLVIREVLDRLGGLDVQTAAWLSKNLMKDKGASLKAQSPFLNSRRPCLRWVSGHLILTPGALFLSSRSTKRLREGKRMLIAMLGDSIKRRARHYHNIQNSMMEAIITASTAFSWDSPDSRQLLFSRKGKGKQKFSYDRVKRQRAIKEIVKLLEKIKGTGRNKTEADRKQVSGEPGDFTWLRPEYARVAGQVLAKMREEKYSPRQQENSLKLWYDYCSRQQPSIRKEAVWTATIIYAVACLEMDLEVRQCELAKEFGVAASTISANFRSLCRALELVAFDRRYSTLTLPAKLTEIDPVLARNMENLRL